MHSDTTTWADGMVSEWCGEFIDSDHKTIQQLVARFGLETADLGQKRKDRTQNVMYLFNRYYEAEELARDFEALASILQPQVQEAGFPTTHTHFTETGDRLAHLAALCLLVVFINGAHNVYL